MNQRFDCARCGGQGFDVVPECCGRGNGYGECCGEPVPRQVPCEGCGGVGYFEFDDGSGRGDE